jgi:hypothetical protein
MTEQAMSTMHTILVTRQDLERLRALLDTGASTRDAEARDALEEELAQ